MQVNVVSDYVSGLCGGGGGGGRYRTILDVASETIKQAIVSLIPYIDGRVAHVNHPPSPMADTCKPELPTRRYSMSLFLFGHAIVIALN